MRTKSLLSRSALLIAFLLIIACFSILFIISSDESVAYASAEDALTTSSISTYQSRVNRSVALYDNIIKSYIINKIRSNDRDITVYSNDFAGIFIDEAGILNVGLVVNDSAITQLEKRNDITSAEPNMFEPAPNPIVQD